MFSVTFFPCEHTCVCDDCRIKNRIGRRTGIGGWNQCPLCQEEIKLILKRTKTTTITTTTNNNNIDSDGGNNDNRNYEISEDDIYRTIDSLREQYWNWVHEVKPYLHPSFTKQFRRKSKTKIKKVLTEAAIVRNGGDNNANDNNLQYGGTQPMGMKCIMDYTACIIS